MAAIQLVQSAGIESSPPSLITVKGFKPHMVTWILYEQTRSAPYVPFRGKGTALLPFESNIPSLTTVNGVQHQPIC